MGEAGRIKERRNEQAKRRAEHLEAIADELAKPNPNYGLIRYWEREVRGWDKTLERLDKRLEKRKRRGR